MKIDSVCEKFGTKARAYRLTLTPQLAKDFLAVMIKNRPVRRARVRFYQAKIRSNEWAYTGQALIFDTLGRLIDGQHRCLAVIAENASIEVLIVLDVDPESYRFLDQGAVRSGKDFLDGIPSQAATSAALSWIWCEERGVLNHGGTGGMPACDAPGMLERFPGIIDSVRNAQMCTHLLGKGMIGYAIYRAQLYNQTMSEKFFRALSNGENLTSGSPVLLLRNRILFNKQSKSKLNPVELMALIIKSWSKFVNNESVLTLRWRREGDAAEPFPAWPGRSVSEYAVT